MKKAIAVFLAVLMVMPLAFAGYEKGSRISVYDESDALPFKEITTDNSPDYKEVVVCMPRDKDLAKTYAFMPNKSFLGIARTLYHMAKGSDFNHFGCVRMRV